MRERRDDGAIHQKRTAIGLGGCHHRCADISRRACAVFDHDGLLQQRFETLRDHARCDVRGSARTERRNELYLSAFDIVSLGRT